MKHTNTCPVWKNLFVIFSLIFLSLPAFSQTPQSHLWSVADSYFKFTPTPGVLTQLPHGSGASDHQGAAPVYSSNAAHTANGDLLVHPNAQ